MLDVYAAEVHFPIPLNAPFDDFPASYQAGWVATARIKTMFNDPGEG